MEAAEAWTRGRETAAREATSERRTRTVDEEFERRNQANEAAAVRAEIDRLSGKEYQHQLLDEGGYAALQANEQEIRKLQKRLERVESRGQTEAFRQVQEQLRGQVQRQSTQRQNRKKTEQKVCNRGLFLLYSVQA
mgnify:CR=1 FL=1